MEITWDDLGPSEWDGLAGGALPLQQAHGYGCAMAALGARVRRAVILRDGHPAAMAQVLERRGLRLVSRGPVWLDGEPAIRRPVLRRLARWTGLTVATPGASVSGVGFVRLITPVHHALWRLDPDPAVMQAGLAPKWRRRLNAAARVLTPPEQVDPQGPEARRVLDAAAAEGRAKGYRTLPPGFVAVWPGAARAWVWRAGSEIAAGVVVLRHGPWASYHAGWAGPAARAASAHRPLLWQAACMLAGEGVTTFDLGTICDETGPGLAQFKRGTGAEVVALGPTLWVLP